MNHHSAAAEHTTGIEDVAISMATRVGLLLSGVAIQSILAYALLPAGRGEFAVCILFASLTGVLLTPGAEAGTQYFLMAKKMTVSQAVAVSLFVCVVAALIASVLSIPLISSELVFFAKADATSFHIALVLVPLTTFSNALRHQVAALLRFRRLAVFSLVQTSATGLTLVLVVMAFRFGVRGALISVCVGNIVMIVACIRDLKRNAGLGWRLPDQADILQVLRYGMKYHVARLGGGLDARIGVLLLSLMAERVEIGLFAVASGLMSRLLVISNAVFIPLLPRASARDDGRPALVAFCARVTLWVTGAAVAVVLVLSRPIIQVLFSSEFLPIIPLIRIVAPGILAYAGASILTAYFRARNRPGICSWAVGIGLACNVVIVPVLYPFLAVEAAAWGMVVGLLIRSAFLGSAFSTSNRVRLRALLIPMAEDLRIVVRMTRMVILRFRARASTDG